MASRGRRIVSPTDRPENETAAETQTPQHSEQTPLASPPEGFAAQPEQSEQAMPSSAASNERTAPPRLSDVAGEAGVAPAVSHETSSRGWEAVNEAVAGYTCRSIDLAARTAIDMLGAKTWSDAVAVNAALARSGFAEWLDSSAKISAAGVDLAAESVKPVVGGLGGLWSVLPNSVRPRR
jgi:hypothetical protein